MKKGSGRSCLVQLALWVALAATAGLTLRAAGARDPGGIAGVSAGAGLLAAMAGILFFSVWEVARERRLLRAASGGKLPADGKWAAVSGTIESTEPLVAPLSGQRVALYEYSVRRWVRLGKGPSLQTWFEGKGLAPTAVRTPGGLVKLLAVPRMEELEVVDLERQRAVANAARHVATAAFEKRDTGQERVAVLEREWADDDGRFESHRRHVELDADLTVSDLVFAESHLKPGATVCLFGVYSAARNGIVPDTAWGRQPRIVLGSAAPAAAELRGRMVRYAIAGVVLLAAACAIVSWSLESLRVD